MYDARHMDRRSAGGSKTGLIRGFLREGRNRAFYATEVTETLAGEGVAQRDVMMAVRRAEREGLVYAGYRTHDRQTPFREGYLVTWISEEALRKNALSMRVSQDRGSCTVTVPSGSEL
jgi:predicted GNAT family acetyltransferase